MSSINDKATVELFVNGEQAEQTMDSLRKKAADLTDQIDKANAAGDTKTAKKLQKELDQVTKQLNRTESAAKGTGIVLNNLSNTNIHGLNNALKFLQRELRNTKPGTEAWERYADAIEKVKGRINELNDKLDGSKSVWSRFKGWATDAWPAIDLLTDWGSSAFDIMRGAVDAYAEMDQEMANVRKFTGMAAEQVADLNEEFMKMDTRTSREELNKLAQEAGRLGKTTKEDVLGFVRAADIINVALDDLGEGATLKLSKLTGVFGIEGTYGTEQSLLKVGSVINELSQNCAASASYLEQFASRMGGVGAQANMTIPQIMAFGAVLDANGQAVEASSTALSQVIVRMMQEPAKYAQVAGLDVKKFTDMLRTDVNGALILFLDTLNKAGGMETLSPMFKDMGENGSRAIAAMSTLATHIDELKSQQREANKAFQEGTSVQNEFNVQNTTVQASIEKAKKAFNELRVELGERLSPMMSHLISSSSAAIRALLTLVRFVMDNKVAIISLTAGIVAYSAAANIATIKTSLFNAASKLLNVALAAQRLGLIAVSGVTAILSGNVTRATAAFRLFSTTIKANPIGLVVGLVTSAVVAIGGWISKTREAKKAEAELAQQRREKAEEYRKQITDISQTTDDLAKSHLDKLDRLYNATQDQTKSMKERISAVKDLQKTYPSAFGNLSQEAILAGKASKAYQDLSKNIIKAARAKAAVEKIQENEKILLELEVEREDIENTIREDSKILDRAQDKRKALGRSLSSNNRYSLTGPSKAKRQELANAVAVVDDINRRLDSSSERLEEIIMQTGELEKANEKLAKKAGDASKIAPDIDFSSPVVDPATSGQAYVSKAEQKKAAAEQKKKDAEARRAAAKARKEFKEQLDAFKAQKSAADLEVLELYKAGTIDYQELMERRHQNELDFYDDSLDHFEAVFSTMKDSYLDDDKDYQKLLLDREKSDQRYQQSRIALELESINRRKSMEEQTAQHNYDVLSDPTVLDEIALQAELYRIRMEALESKKALYSAGSKEYADTQYEIESLELEKEMNMEKMYFDAVKKLNSEYDKKSAAEKYNLEKATLDALLDAEMISAEQYAKFLKGLADKYKAELPGESGPDADRKKYEDDKKALEDALKSELITQADFNRRMAALDQERRDKMIAGLKQTGGEWNSMLADIYSSFASLLSGLDGPLQATLYKISNCTAAVSSAIGAAMQIATEFSKAESEIQIKAVESRYDREIELAQGNTYKIKAIEKKKEKETAEIKNKASKKQYEMQVIQAVTQAITAGLNAYASTLAIPVVGPALAPVAMSVALAMGGMQVALIKKQQQAAEANGYSRGGFTRPGRVDEPAGVVHAGEWVASQKLLANPVARPMIDALDRVQRSNTISSLRADDVSRSITAPSTITRIAESDDGSAVMVAAALQMSQTVAALKGRLDEPFVTINTVTGPLGSKQAKDQYSRMINNITPKSRRKWIS